VVINELIQYVSYIILPYFCHFWWSSI